MSAKWKWIIGLVVIVGLTGAWVISSSSTIDTKKKIRSPLYTVTSGDLLVSVTESGELMAVEQTEIKSPLSGRTNVAFVVEEGTVVQKGDLLIEFNRADLESDLKTKEIQYQSSVSESIQAREDYEIRKSMNASEIKAAELKLQFSKLDLEKYENGEWPLKVKQQKGKIALAHDELTRARDRLSWTKQLQEKGYATRSELEADELKVKRMKLDLEGAQDQLKMMETYDYPQTLTKLNAEVEKTTQELDRVKRRGRAELARSESKRQEKEANLINRETQVSDAKEELSMARILAPKDGLVIYHPPRRNRDPLQVGAEVQYRQHLLDLPDTDEMMIELRVHEARVGQIALGQTAFVNFDAFPENRYRGEVMKIADMPDSGGWWSTGIKVYKTQILLKEKLPPNAKPGLSGKAEVLVAKLENVISVPIQAVTTQKKQQVCYLKLPNSYEAAVVKVGEYNDTHVQILEGLKVGDKVLLNPPKSDEAEMLGLSVMDDDEVTKEDVKEGRPGTGGVMTNSSDSNPGKMPDIRVGEAKGKEPKRKKDRKKKLKQ